MVSGEGCIAIQQPTLFCLLEHKWAIVVDNIFTILHYRKEPLVSFVVKKHK